MLNPDRLCVTPSLHCLPRSFDSGLQWYSSFVNANVSVKSNLFYFSFGQGEAFTSHLCWFSTNNVSRSLPIPRVCDTTRQHSSKSHFSVWTLQVKVKIYPTIELERTTLKHDFRTLSCLGWCVSFSHEHLICLSPIYNIRLMFLRPQYNLSGRRTFCYAPYYYLIASYILKCLKRALIPIIFWSEYNMRHS